MDSTEAVLKGLESSDSEERALAAESAGTLRMAEAVPLLTKALEDPNFLVQLFSLKSLGEIGAPAASAASALAGKLDDDAMRVYAIDSLGGIGPAASQVAPRLREFLMSSDEGLRAAAAVALHRITEAPELPQKVLDGLFRDGTSSEARVQATTELARMGYRTHLISALGDDDAAVRLAAARASADGGADIVDALVRQLGDPDHLVRLEAACVLVNLSSGHAAAVACLEDLASPGGTFDTTVDGALRRGAKPDDVRDRARTALR